MMILRHSHIQPLHGLCFVEQAGPIVDGAFVAGKQSHHQKIRARPIEFNRSRSSYSVLGIAPAEVDLLLAGIGFQAVAFGIDYERRVVVLTVVGAQARLAVVPAAVLERSGVE
jgi:hypothetical protein